IAALAANTPGYGTLTRRDALDTATRLDAEARAGAGLLIGGAALAVVAGVLTIVYRRDIFGTTAPEVAPRDTRSPSAPGGSPPRASLRPSFALVPTSHGALAAAQVRW